MLKKLKDWILPKEIDFFGSLYKQSIATKAVIEKLIEYYSSDSNMDHDELFSLIEEAKNLRKIHIKELNSTFITPVDKEAISRVYTHLNWIVLSIKHLVIEADIYKIFDLKDYKNILDILFKEINELTSGIKYLSNKNYDKILLSIDKVINFDDNLIKEYASALAIIFQKAEKGQMEQKEILSQIKEISKRIHFCANYLEDIVFKLN